MRGLYRYTCVTNMLTPTTQSTPPTTTRFIIAFLFVTLLGALIAAGPKYGLSSSRPFWIGMFAINALLYMLASEATLAA